MTASESTLLNSGVGLSKDHLPHSIGKRYQLEASTFLDNAVTMFPNLVIGDLATVQHKLSCMMEKGSENVHFISDFDMTMTQQWVNGKRGVTSHGVIAKYPRFPDSFRHCVSALYQKYYPIEIDPCLPLKEKYKFMEEWWVKSHDTIIETGLSKHDLASMAKQSTMVWRPKLDNLLERLNFLSIPFLVFSAGLEDLIRPILHCADLLFPNVDVISNRMAFDEDGFATRFLPPVIHTLNKREIRILDHLPHLQAIQSCRTNVIVMGDSLGDAAMAEGVHHDVVLKIGFYNLHENGNLEKYKRHFDLVLTGDLGFDFVLALVECIHTASR